MTVSVRPWPEIAADLRKLAWYRRPDGLDVVVYEAAVAGDALAAEVAAVVVALTKYHLRRRAAENATEAAFDCIEDVALALKWTAKR